MKNNVSNLQLYKGYEIDKEIIKVVKNISFIRYDKTIYDSNYKDVKIIEDLSNLYGVSEEDINLVLGNDWFLFYEDNPNYIKFLEWVAENNKDKKLTQSIEILRVFKNLLFENREKLFIANMRHDTSFLFYKSMLDRGYLNEIYHLIDIDCCFNNTPQEIIDLKEKYKDLDLALNNKAINEEYLKYIIHLTGFEVTEKFIKRQIKFLE